MKYITDILKMFIDRKFDPASDFFQIITEELCRLNTLCILPEKRVEFILIKARYKKLAGISSAAYRQDFDHAEELIAILDTYGSNNIEMSGRSFGFLQDRKLEKIIVRDYNELNNILFPEGAWKSSVIMAGSILEAILVDILSSHTYLSKAGSSSKAPKSGNSIVLPIEKWTLSNLIEVSVDIKILSENRAKSIDQILRDYRNYVHPKKEVRAKHPITEAEALMAKGALDAVCNHLEEVINH